MKPKRNDLILLACIVIIISAAFLLVRQGSGAKGTTVVIISDGAEWARLPLDSDCRVDIPGLIGINTIEIKDGEVCMEKADCPDGICQKHKPISCEGEAIICLPNRIIVEIEGGEPAEVDAIVGR